MYTCYFLYFDTGWMSDSICSPHLAEINEAAERLFTDPELLYMCIEKKTVPDTFDWTR